MSKQKGGNIDYDSLLEFQVKLEGVCNGLAKEMVGELDKSDAQLLRVLKERLAKPIDHAKLKEEVKRIQDVCKSVYELRAKAIENAKDITIAKCSEVAEAAQENQRQFLGQFGKEIRPLSKSKVKEIIGYSLFNGLIVSEWFGRYAENDKNRITSAIMKAASEGLSLHDIVKVIRGSKADGYTQGVLKVSRQSATTIARTLINGVANETRMELLEENADVTDGVRFLATLDGKTSFICASLDGTIWRNDELDKVKRPPLHPNCRSTLIPYIEIRDEDGNIVETSGRPAANADFDKLAEDAYNAKAKEKGWSRRFKDLSPSTRDKYYYQAQKDYEARTGKPAYRNVSNRTNFREYFEKQPEEFKRSWLGETRYRLYSEGKLDFAGLVKSDSGYVVPVSELQKPYENDLKGKKTGNYSAPTPLQTDKTSYNNIKSDEGVEVKTFPVDPNDLEYVKSLGGSTGAELVRDKFGNTFVRKRGGNSGGDAAGHLRNECAVDQFYRDSGVNVPEFKLYETDDGPVKLSRFIDDGSSLNDWWKKATPSQRNEMKKRLREGFAVDVMTGNWDVVGMAADNILVDKDGTPWRIDNGGAFGYRAQGAKKTAEQWSRYPDDIWTMLGRSQDILDTDIASNCPQYFGKVDILDLMSEIKDRDWSPALANLSASDRDIMTGRIRETEKLALRGNDFIASGHTKDYTEGILCHSYRMTKENITADIAPNVVCKDGRILPTDFGRFRTDKTQSGSGLFSLADPKKNKNVDWTKILPPEEDVKATIQEALQHHKVHFGPNGDQKVDNELFKKTSALYQQITAFAGTGDPSAQHYAKIIEKVYDAFWDQKVLSPKDFDLTPPLFSNIKPNATPASKYKSFTDHVQDYIKRSMKTKHGVDYDPRRNFITTWQERQGVGSYETESCKAKIVRMESLGIDWKDPEEDAEKYGFYYGEGKSKHQEGYNEARNEYKNSPEQLEQDKEVFQRYHAAVQLALEECSFEGNDHQYRDVILVRTEHEDIAKMNPGQDEGKKCSHRTGINESHSVFATTQVEGKQITIVRVPYSRITGMYFAERRPGSNVCAFHGDNENEFTACTMGLDIRYAGEYDRQRSKTEYYQHLPKRRQKN